MYVLDAVWEKKREGIKIISRFGASFSNINFKMCYYTEKSG
jgi:hypothetical protein